jgi:hypothetical protein
VRLTFRTEAAPHERFAESAARSLIGQRARFNARQEEDGPILADLGYVFVVDAEVIDEGRALLITYETDGRRV